MLIGVALMRASKFSWRSLWLVLTLHDRELWIQASYICHLEYNYEPTCKDESTASLETRLAT